MPNFNSTKVQFGATTNMSDKLYKAISIPLRYNLERNRDQRRKESSSISIPLRYNLEGIKSYQDTINMLNFNSTKVQFGGPLRKSIKLR